MAYTDFIAAIDLGTSHMVGMVGTKNATGALSIDRKSTRLNLQSP